MVARRVGDLSRSIDLEQADNRVTAEQWLVAHRADQAEDEQTRAITEDDLEPPTDHLDTP